MNLTWHTQGDGGGNRRRARFLGGAVLSMEKGQRLLRVLGLGWRVVAVATGGGKDIPTPEVFRRTLRAEASLRRGTGLLGLGMRVARIRRGWSHAAGARGLEAKAARTVLTAHGGLHYTWTFRRGFLCCCLLHGA